MRRMTKEEVLAWRERWQIVNDFEVDELRRKTPEDKLRELASLMASVRHFGWETVTPEEVERARESWLELYKAYGSAK